MNEAGPRKPFVLDEAVERCLELGGVRRACPEDIPGLKKVRQSAYIGNLPEDEIRRRMEEEGGLLLGVGDSFYEQLVDDITYVLVNPNRSERSRTPLWGYSSVYKAPDRVATFLDAYLRSSGTPAPGEEIWNQDGIQEILDGKISVAVSEEIVRMPNVDFRGTCLAGLPFAAFMKHVTYRDPELIDIEAILSMFYSFTDQQHSVLAERWNTPSSKMTFGTLGARPLRKKRTTKPIDSNWIVAACDPKDAVENTGILLEKLYRDREQLRYKDRRTVLLSVVAALAAIIAAVFAFPSKEDDVTEEERQQVLAACAEKLPDLLQSLGIDNAPSLVPQRISLPVEGLHTAYGVGHPDNWIVLMVQVEDGSVLGIVESSDTIENFIFHNGELTSYPTGSQQRTDRFFGQIRNLGMADAFREGGMHSGQFFGEPDTEGISALGGNSEAYWGNKAQLTWSSWQQQMQLLLERE